MSAAIPCTTTKATSSRIPVTRYGDVHPTSIGIQLTPFISANSALLLVSILHVAREADVANGALWTAPASDWTHVRMPTTTLPSGARVANLTGLVPGSTYYVRVNGHDAVMMKTSAPGMLYTTLHRISEYAEDVDFLENHNSASVEAMPLCVHPQPARVYLRQCQPIGQNPGSY
eukprot:m.79597 g.79597  ORF g.79597 m.79597 type:complete len:174 (+) comp16277_c0_seq4:753-1274(+)